MRGTAFDEADPDRSAHSWNRGSVTGDANRGILRSRSRGIEARPVRAEAEAAADRRVTRGAIALRVAADAAFKALTRGLAVAEIEAAEGVVVAGGAESPARDQA